MDYINVGLKKFEIKTKTKTKQNKTTQQQQHINRFLFLISWHIPKKIRL